jgi:hypothetical protein
MLPTHIASDDGKLPSGRQGREGRDFLSLLKQPFFRKFHIHERRPRACVQVGKNNGDVFSQPSRPCDAVGDLRSEHGAGRTHFRRNEPVAKVAEADENAPNATDVAKKVAA